jgi:uncharacterized membrane protein YesL
MLTIRDFLVTIPSSVKFEIGGHREQAMPFVCGFMSRKRTAYMILARILLQYIFLLVPLDAAVAVAVTSGRCARYTVGSLRPSQLRRQRKNPDQYCRPSKN